METKTRLHPLLIVAAVSLTIFSAVGIAALTGALPHSRSSSEPIIAPEVQKPIEHVITAPVAKPKPRPVAQAPKVQEAPKRVYEAPKPAPLPGVGGVIESVKEIEQAPDKTIAGPVAGGVAGAVIGHQVGEGRTRMIATAIGAGAGILAGRAIEKKVRTEKLWETTVRLEDGSTQSFKSEAQPAWQSGERVRVVEGRILKSQG
jgi:outer membrane lipoprotein SlyB